MTSDGRPTVRMTFGLVLVTVVVPLAILGIALWELQRGDIDRWDLEVKRGYLGQTIQRMETWLAANPIREMQLQFRRNGQLYGGPYALDQARGALGDAETAVLIERWRRVLPPVTIACAGLSDRQRGAVLEAHRGRDQAPGLVGAEHDRQFARVA